MKRTVLLFLVLFAATSLFAGGKECEARAKKNVELTGTLLKASSETGDQYYFRASDGSKLAVCHKSKAAALKFASEPNTTLRVKGAVVTCGEKQELMIEEARKV